MNHNHHRKTYPSYETKNRIKTLKSLHELHNTRKDKGKEENIEHADEHKDAQHKDKLTDVYTDKQDEHQEKHKEHDKRKENLSKTIKDLKEQKKVKKPAKSSKDNQNLRDLMDELSHTGQINALKSQDIDEYVDNYSDISGDITKKTQELYEAFLKKNKLAIKHLSFLDNSVIQDRNLINTYFDRIYVLNLDRRPDRWLKMKKNLDDLGVYNYERFSAVDGSLSPHYQEWKHYSKMPLTRHELIRYKRKAIGSAGSWAILKASYRMLRDAKERGFKRILVLQDDLLFHKNFLSEFAKVPSYIKDWKLLYLGATQHNWARILKSKSFYYPAGTADGAFAVGIDSSIYDELMKEIIKFNMPFDSGPLRTLQERYLYESYVIYPNIIIADIRDSDLRHSRDLETFGKRFHWDTNLYDIPS